MRDTVQTAVSSAQNTVHVAISGAGIIGLAAALAFRRRGMQVTALEAETPMKEASWAAGGMLAVEDPGNPPALLPLSRYSRGLYGEFLQEIATLSGISIPLRTNETVQIVNPREATTGRILQPEEARRLVPGLSETGRSYALLEEVSLDPRDLCHALPAAARAAGVTVREQERVLSVASEAGGVDLTTTRGRMRADVFLNCCGAWTSEIDESLEIAPRKGQMLVLAQPGHAALTRVLRSPDVYLIPRGDGRIVVGATVEDAGYSKDVDSAALASLRQLAAELWPPILCAPLVESWAGLRPATADGLPLIGQNERGDTLQFVAAGHYRNGILLAPGTAQIVAALICGKTPAIDLAPFAPHRASLSAVCDKHFAAAL